MSQNAEFAEIYARTIPAVWRFVRSRVSDRDQAEDVTSEVYVRALAAWHRFDEQRGSPAAWLCGIATHVVQETRRRRNWVSSAPAWEPTVDDRAGDDPQPDALVLKAEDRSRLRAALALLTDREREALALRFAGGLRTWEIAVILGLSAGATKMLVFRAMRRLRETLDLEAPPPAGDRVAATALDETVDHVLARRGGDLPEGMAERLVRELAIIYSSPVPKGLTERVSAIVACPVARAIDWPSRPFQAAAVVVATGSFLSAAWRWQDAVAAAAAPNLVEVTLLILAGCAMLAGLGFLMRRPRLGSGAIGIGGLIFAFCLWWTGIAPVIGLVMAGTAFRHATRRPVGLSISGPGAFTVKG